MANNTDNPRFYVLDTAGTIVAAGTEVIVRALEFEPDAASNVAVIEEFATNGSTQINAAHLKANGTEVCSIHRNFGANGRRMNGFILDTITAGTLYVYIGKD